ncbi:endonuclease NucS domain-containing protein [Rhodocaloribacter sp.]
MGTEIKAWEIIDGRPCPLESDLAQEGRTEAYDLEEWLASVPSIVRPGLKVIGRQVRTRSGPLDLLAVDRAGNLVIIELKRNKLPREALTQAIDYAADVASWGVEKVGEVCAKYTGKSLEDVLSEAFPDVDLEGLSINETQRVILVGFAVEPALERMIEWLSEGYGVGINAVVLKYVRTSTGNEVLTRSAVISEQVEAERTKRAKKFTIPMSDEPGEYEEDQLRELLSRYLAQDSLVSAQRIRDVLLPACLEQDIVTRDTLKQEFVRKGAADDISKAGYMLSVISGQIGIQKNDFLRQVIGYGYPNNPWEKDNYFIRPEYKDLVHEVLSEPRGAET